ncbi:hypothetical protein DOTSEDRAFT_46763 [Dothistroma septosporum NZE10]|uniref:Uncharacterized protein n=1 Tax=Dothistroma septosporum (strain NZE10 / CBS 128990) TaxID=675120 RepID=N1PHN2_DOTSN|nr:hypothetical protein DOTSEDRAFT_46763 [Dothistroma septosporum NZE10]
MWSNTIESVAANTTKAETVAALLAGLSANSTYSHVSCTAEARHVPFTCWEEHQRVAPENHLVAQVWFTAIACGLGSSSRAANFNNW